jgi:hypothetical protein
MLKVMIWGGLLLAAVNLLARYLSMGASTTNPSSMPLGSPEMIWFGLIAAGAGLAFDRWTRLR